MAANLLSKPTLFGPTLWLSFAVLSGSCEAPPQAIPDPMPKLEWTAPDLPTFGDNASTDFLRRRGVEALKEPLAVPDALETLLTKEDREKWRVAVEGVERYRLLAEKTIRLATSPSASTQGCDTLIGPAPVIRDPWRVRAQLLIQQRYNVLWKLGRLELAARSFHGALRGMREAFGSERSRHADEALLGPLDAILAQLEHFDTPQTRPNGDWDAGDHLTRFARHRPVYKLLLYVEEALLDWRERTVHDKRWSYTASAADRPIEAIAAWRTEHDALIDAVEEYAEQASGFSRTLGRPSSAADQWTRCTIVEVGKLAKDATIYELTIKMQKQLALAGRSIRDLERSLKRGGWKEELPAILEGLRGLRSSIDRTSESLMSLENATLRQWTESEQWVWERLFPEVARPEAEVTPTSAADRAAWRTEFFESRKLFEAGRRREEPEPTQPIPRGRHRKVLPFVTEVLDTARSPARVAEVEQGLLAISELDAHLASMHENIFQACREGDCTGLPRAEVPNSPRNSSWVVDWRALPVEQRTLGHNVIVLELSRLHLARQMHRLAAVHAWFSELSSADLSWAKLETWEQTWSLYTNSAGSYLSFLRDVDHVASSVRGFSLNRESRAVSKRMEKLLAYQTTLFGLTVDYARFVDAAGEAPVPVETLLSAWDRMHAELAAIEVATLERDENLRLAAEAQRLREEEERKAKAAAEAKARADAQAKQEPPKPNGTVKKAP